MKRMVLIPEERLIRYEKQMNEQTGGVQPPIHYPAGNYPGYNYLYNYPKYPGSMIGGGEDGGEETPEDSLSTEMIVRSIPKTMKKKSRGITSPFKRKRRYYYVG